MSDRCRPRRFVRTRRPTGSPPPRSLLSLATCTVLFASFAAFWWPSTAAARGRPSRSGGQIELLTGVSACVPGAARCRLNDDGVSGRAAPMIGAGVNAGYRLRRSLFLGVGYAMGFFNPSYELEDGSSIRLAYQQGLFFVLRGILPLGRFDLGLELSPGASRVVRRPDGDGDVRYYSQGFALRPGLSVDYWLGQRFFLGAKADLILNLHRNACVRVEENSTCEHKESIDTVAVHQIIGGIHVGGTF